MATRETKFIAAPGMQTGESIVAFLNVTRHTPVGDALDTKREEFHYELCFNEDTSEVMLVKGDEIIYSEILDTEGT